MPTTEQVRPLAMSSPDPASLEEGSRGDGLKFRGALRKRRGLLCCLGCCSLLLVLLALAVLILALVFHIKNPTLTMNSIHVDGLSRAANGSPSSASSRPVNITLTADISMRNPNGAPFSFSNSTVEFRDSAARVVGLATVPAGKVGGDRSVRFNLTVAVNTTGEAAKDLAERNGTTAGVELSSYSETGGTVNVLGMYKRHKTIVLSCNFTVDISLSDQLINNPACTSRTK